MSVTSLTYTQLLDMAPAEMAAAMAKDPSERWSLMEGILRVLTSERAVDKDRAVHRWETTSAFYADAAERVRAVARAELQMSVARDG